MSQTRTFCLLLGALVALAPAASATCVNGTSGNDTINGTSGVDCILGFGGNDSLYGLGDADQIEGGNDDDYIEGGDGDDYIDEGTGSGGPDWGYGQNGNDTILAHNVGNPWAYAYGGADNDTLNGDSGWQNLFGDSVTGDSADGSSDYDWCKGSETQVNCECQEIFFEDC
jgi:Ca2+-binding RTX toxin-like protein